MFERYLRISVAVDRPVTYSLKGEKDGKVKVLERRCGRTLVRLGS